eukprot:tig00021494_g21928.t1
MAFVFSAAPIAVVAKPSVASLRSTFAGKSVVSKKQSRTFVAGSSFSVFASAEKQGPVSEEELVMQTDYAIAFDGENDMKGDADADKARILAMRAEEEKRKAAAAASAAKDTASAQDDDYDAKAAAEQDLLLNSDYTDSFSN